MTTVYRVQLGFSLIGGESGPHSNIGPYGNSRVLNIPWDTLGFRDPEDYMVYESSVDKPTPFRDGIDPVPPNYLFGFINHVQLFSWFDGIEHQLKDSGLMVAEFEVPEEYIIHGTCQVCFKIGAARLVALEDIVETMGTLRGVIMAPPKERTVVRRPAAYKKLLSRAGEALHKGLNKLHRKNLSH